MTIVADTFVRLHRLIFGKPLNGRASKEELLEFRSLFGAPPVVCASLFRRCRRLEGPNRVDQPIHLLWTMAFLKLYITGNAFAKMFKVSKRTFFYYVWPGVSAIASLKPSVVSITYFVLLLCFCLSLINASHLSRSDGKIDFETTGGGLAKLQ